MHKVAIASRIIVYDFLAISVCKGSVGPKEHANIYQHITSLDSPVLELKRRYFAGLTICKTRFQIYQQKNF